MNWRRLMIFALGCCVIGQPAAAQERPFSVQLWDFYRWNADGSEQNKADLRFYQDLELGGGWLMRFREDLPLITTDKMGPDNSAGTWSTGIGDVFVQAIAVTPPILPDVTAEFGLRVVFPTGGLSPFGDGSYQLGPMLGLSYHNPDVLDGLTVAPHARYLVSVARTDDNAKTVRKLQLYPRTELSLGEDWRLGFWVENPIVYDRKDGTWFVPLDVMVTHDIGKHVALRLGGATALVKNSSDYDNMIYGRLSFRF